MAEYVAKDAAMDQGALYDWYISSVSEDDPPVWTDEHIDELLNDFLVIPKETPAADVVAVVRCRDCRFYYDKHYEDEGEPPYIKRCCKYSNHTRQPDDFCSLGERKSGEQNDG